jgi:hypothetical protein
MAWFAIMRDVLRPRKTIVPVLAGRRYTGRPGVSGMKQWKFLALPLVCLLFMASAACDNKESGGKSSSGPGEERIGKFKLGRGFDKDGEAVTEGRAFAKGDKVYVSFAILDAQRDAQARILWVTKPGVKVAEETKPLPRGDRVVSFTADTKTWEPGTYMVETWVVESGANGVRRLGSADFTVADSSMK